MPLQDLKIKHKPQKSGLKKPKTKLQNKGRGDAWNWKTTQDNAMKLQVAISVGDHWEKWWKLKVMERPSHQDMLPKQWHKIKLQNPKPKTF